MRIQEADENYRSYLKMTDLDNLFQLWKDSRGKQIFNLNETLYVDASAANLSEYVTDCDSHWPLVSYNVYKTTRLAWLLMKLNGVQAEEMFDIVPAGTTVKVIDMTGVQTILKSINGYI